MATLYEQQATQQLAPVFDQQQQAIQSQVPAIQNLYQTLTQGLNQQYTQNLNAGVQGIVEDASARGVLRSTLPVDARQALTGQLGSALQQSLGQLGANQAKDISGISMQLGDLGLKRASSIADLSRSLETQDLQRQQLEQQRIQDERNYQMQQQELAIARQRASGSSTPSIADQKAMMQQAIQVDIANAFRSANAGKKSYTEQTVLPLLYQQYGVLGNDFINKAVYQYRKNELGY